MDFAEFCAPQPERQRSEPAAPPVPRAAASQTARTSAASSEAAGNGRIKNMGASTAMRICSDQVVVDMRSALKELVENSLDAGATKVELRLKEHGTELLEVCDNGGGIPANDLDGIALRHHTSKLQTFDGLSKLSSFGFRGEALNSLAALGTLTISTRTAADKVGTLLTFGRDGAVASRTPLARDVGTSVSVANLFEPFPVRRRELLRAAQAEMRKMLAALQAYSLICHTVRFNCSHTTSKGKAESRTSLLQTEGGAGGYRSAVASVFGSKQLRELTPLSAQGGGLEVSGLLSLPRAGFGRRTSDRQYLFVNRRPVDFPRLSRLINDSFRTATAKSECFPFVILNVQAPGEAFDVNVTPDKRTVLFSDEASLLNLVSDMLAALFTA